MEIKIENLVKAVEKISEISDNVEMQNIMVELRNLIDYLSNNEINNKQNLNEIGKNLNKCFNYFNKEIDNMKTLHNSDISGAEKNVPDIQKVGNGDMFQLLCKASSKKEGWMKSTKACEIPGVGCIVQATTQQNDNVAEAICFVPEVKIADDINNGRKIVSWFKE